jgi:superfamily II DNA or RNA helicase
LTNVAISVKLRNMQDAKSAKVFQERDYQTRIRAKLLQGWKDGLVSQMIVSATGSGKTPMALAALRDLVEHSQEIFGCEPHEIGIGWMAHRAKLLSQAEAENKMVGLKNIHYISMFDTNIGRHLAGYKIRILAVDEVHHVGCNTATTGLNIIKPDRILGMSATPQRSDRLDLCIQRSITDAGYHRLIQDGWLSKFDHYSIMGEWDPQNVATHYLKDPAKWGQSAMFFLTKDECDICCAALIKGGIRAEVVTGQTDVERQCDDFDDGKLQVLVNMVMLGEGYDAPSMKTVWVRDSGARGPVTQFCGRVLRLFDGPDGKPVVKQIVQSLETKFPFLRVAAARTQIVEVEGVWKTIGMNDRVQRMSAIMQNRISMTIKEDPLPAYIANNKQGTRWKDGDLISDTETVEVMAHVHATLFANINLLASPDGRKLERPKSAFMAEKPKDAQEIEQLPALHL